MANYDKKYNSYYTAEKSKVTDSITSAKNNNLLLDNISNWYIFEDEVRMGFSLLRKYENLIFANAVEVPFESSWKYKPEYASYDIYGTTDFWYFIMFLNRISTVDEFDFTGSTILVPSDELLDTLIQIFSKESRMKETLNNPIRIYKHFLKRLDSPSRQILSTGSDTELDSVNSFKEYKDITNDFLDEENFVHYTEGYTKGILKTEFYEINNNKQNKYKFDKYTNPNFYKVEDYKDEYYGTGLQNLINSENKIQIVKTGFLKPFKTGYYKFRISTNSNFEMYLNNNILIDYKYLDKEIIVPDMKTVKNLFEEYSNNSDFKRRNMDFWNIDTSLSNDTPLLQYNTVLNKTMLDINITENNIDKINNKLIWNINIPINGIKEDVNFDNKVTFENDNDIYYRIDYRLPLGRKNAKLVLTIDFNDENSNLIKSFAKESESFNNNVESQDICSEFIKINKDLIDKNVISSINLKLKIKVPELNNYSDIIKKDGSIARLHIDKVYLYTLSESYDYLDENSVIYLDENISYDFKSIFQQKYNEPYKYFNLEYAFLGENKNNTDNIVYKRIPIGWFYIKNPTFDGIESYNEYIKENISKYLNIDIYSTMKDFSDLFINDRINDKDYLYNNKDIIINIFKLINLFGNTNNPLISYFINNNQNLIRLDIYNNSNKELLEEYFVESIESGYDIINEFNLSKKYSYKLSYNIPLNKDNFIYKNNTLSFKSLSNFNRDIKNIFIENIGDRINLYLFKSSIIDKNIVSDNNQINDLFDYRGDNSNSQYYLLGQKNFSDKTLEINPNSKDIKDFIIDKYTDEILVNSLIIDIITILDENNDSYYLNFSINENNNDLISDELSLLNYIPSFLNEEYLKFIYTINWYKIIKDKYISPIKENTTYFQIKENILKSFSIKDNDDFINFLVDEFIVEGLFNKYDFNDFIMNLISIKDLFEGNIKIPKTTDEKIYLPNIFGFNPAFKNNILHSSNIFNSFLPENYLSDNYFTRAFSGENLGILKDFIKNLYNYTDNNIDFNILNRTGLYKGNFRQLLQSPLKNTKYTMISKNILSDDFSLILKFISNKYKQYENQKDILSTKQGIFGILFDFNTDNSKYALIINLYENYNDLIDETLPDENINTKFIKTGFYKYNYNYENNQYNNEGLDWFKERFEYLDITDKKLNILYNNSTIEEQNALTERIKEVFNFNNLINNDKSIKLMNYNGWIILKSISNNDISESIIQFNDNIRDNTSSYKGGKLGFFSIGMDGINIEMKLFN